MAIHAQQHQITGSDHSAGTTAAANEVNLLGTNSSGTIAELAAEAPGVASTASKVVVRAADGHIAVPTSGQEDGEVLSKGQIVTLISDGIYKSPAFHSAVADHTTSTVGNGTTGGPALAVNDVVLNTTDKKYYKVTSIAGGTTGDLVTYDAGTLPLTTEVRHDKLTDHEWVYDTDGAVWIDRGASTHTRSHQMTGTSDHVAGNWKVFHSNGSGEVIELALGAANAPLLGGGATAAPAFGATLIAPAVIAAAGATPVDSDVTAWGNNTFGVVKGTGGKYFLTFKDATDVAYVEMGVI